MKNFVLIALICHSYSSFGQYPVVASHYHYFKMNALCEDTLSDKVYVQTTGVYMPNRSAAELSAFNLAPLSTGSVINTYTFTPSGGSSLYYSRQLEFGNNKVYVNDTAVVRAVDPATGTIFWNRTFNGGTCHSMSLKGNSLIVIYDSLNSYYDIRIDKINTSTGAIAPLCRWTTGLYSSTQPFLSLFSVRAAKLLNNKLYFGGEFQVLDSLGNTLTNFAVFDLSTRRILPYNAALNGLVNDIEIANNKLYIAGTFTASSFYTRNRFAVFDTSLNLLPAAVSFNHEVNAIEIYNNVLFALGKFTKINSTLVNPAANYVLKAVDMGANAVMSWAVNAVDPTVYASGPDTSTSNRNLKVIRNRLYLSGFAGGPQQLDEYCLPPKLYGGITGPPQVCIPSAGSITYSISPALYANTYNWSYSGTGITLTFTNNVARINYSASSTPGILKVFAQAVCGTNSDTLSLPVSLNPRPAVSAGCSSDTLSCSRRKIKLLGNSTSSPVYYNWSGPSGYTSAQQNDSSFYNGAGSYSLTVSYASTGCASNTVVTLKIDTVRPDIALPSSAVNIVCSPDSSLLNGSSASSPTSIWWHLTGNGVKHFNPYYTKSIGNYYMVVQNTYNGCKDSSLFSVGFKGLPPDIKLLSHLMPAGLSPIDSISCITTSVIVNGGSDTANTAISWRAVPGGTVFSNPVTITAQGNFKLIVQRTDNGCADSSLIVYIKQDKTPPALSILTPDAGINCSSSTATLNAITSTGASMQWTGPGSYASSNPALTPAQGLYYVTATNTGNGCSRKDSVMVGYSPVIVINAGRDTTVCKGSALSLSAAVAGTLGAINYSWSNGDNGQTVSINPVSTGIYIVNASAGSCTGTDTVKVTVPPDLADSVVTAKSCGSAGAGSISVFVKGGIAPYKFSLNGSLYTSQSTYAGLPYGAYGINIKDSIGCTLNTTAVISQNSSLPKPVFIASTKNTKGDTVVLVDLTMPKPDSVQWVLPATATKIGGDMFDPIIVFADTGYFSITLNAFYSNCVISTTKLLRVASYDSTLATPNNNNSIKSLSLFPNPNTGQFTVKVEFYKKQNASVQVWDALSVKYLQQNFMAADSISLPVSLTNLQNGTYILQVIGEYNSRFLNFVISR